MREPTMTHPPRRRPALLLSLLAAVAPLAAVPASALAAGEAARAPAAAASSADDRARFLAGLPVAAGSPLAPLQGSERWRRHSLLMDGAWARMDARLQVLEHWCAKELLPRIKGNLPVLYLFGGPDAITPVVVFPDAPVYVLAGLEPVGQASAPEELGEQALSTALDGLHEALRSVVPAAFFRTIEMGRDLRGKAIWGVRPIAYLFLVRSGARILQADRIEIDPLGFAKPVAEGQDWGKGIQALRIRFQRPGHLAQELVYVQVDLGNDAMREKPGFEAYVQGLGAVNAVHKAASFILYDNHFSTPRELLFRQAVSVFQDDSGAPFSAFKKGAWEFKTWGTYLVPKNPFARNWQAALAKLFESQPHVDLPFRWGYRAGPQETNMLLAIRKEPLR
jgi:hypothetical protein